MFRDTRDLVFAICTGLIWAVIVGCASQTNSEVKSSLHPLPSRPPGRTSPLTRAEQVLTPSDAGTETLPSAPLAQASPSTEALIVPTRQAKQPPLVVQTESPPSGQIRPDRELGGTLTPGSQPDPVPPPPPGYPERLPPSPLMSPDLPVMSLDQLIQIALDNQPRIRSAQAALEGADARVGIARAGYFPVIGTTIGYNRQTSNVAGGINPATGNISVRRVSGLSVNRQDFTARLSQNVFDSFRREGRVQAAREDQDAAEFDLSTTRQDVILNVQQAYYNYLLARRLVEVNQEAVRRNIQNLERARGFFEVGTRPKIDVTRAQVDLANAELALVRARNGVAVAFAALNNAIGVPEHTLYRIPEELEIPPETVTPEELVGTLEESTRIALENRTELRALRARIRSAASNLTLAKRDFLPSLSADANWNYRGQELPYAPNWVVGATLTVPVLNPPLFSQVDQAAANLASAQASEEITAQNIVLEVQQSFVDLVSARERVRTAEVLVTQARENLELAQGRYQVGVGPLIDVTDAQLALTQAESENIQAIVDFKLSEVRLRKAMGLLE
jgi:outer membrane protein